MFGKFKEGRALARIADALDRIAAAQEEQVRLARLSRSGGTGFYTGYDAPAGPEGSVSNESDETYAQWEEIENRRSKGEHVDESEEPR